MNSPVMILTLATVLALACAGGDAGDVTWNGVGPIAFGMTREEATRALGKEAQIQSGPGCSYARLAIGGVERELMIENDRLVRLDVSDSSTSAPGGGRVGIAIAEVRRLYGPTLAQTPHKYVPGASYLTFTNPSDSTRRIVFEIANGTVAMWRIGLVPQVEYVERCG